MSMQTKAALDALVTHGKLSGKCSSFDIGEWVTPPPQSLVGCVFVSNLGVSLTGGLAVTGGRTRFTVRLYHPVVNRPRGEADVKVAEAADEYLRRLNLDLNLGGLARNIDILGEGGGDLADWKFGHITIDAKISKVADLVIDVLFNDVWPQAVS